MPTLTAQRTRLPQAPFVTARPIAPPPVVASPQDVAGAHRHVGAFLGTVAGLLLVRAFAMLETVGDWPARTEDAGGFATWDRVLAATLVACALVLVARLLVRRQRTARTA